VKGGGTYMASMSIAVMNISINRPRTMEVPPPNVVRTLSVPGVMASTMAAPAKG
jgi:hypothetical protein